MRQQVLHRAAQGLAAVTFALCGRSQHHVLAEASLEKVHLASLPFRCQCFELSMLHLLCSVPQKGTSWRFFPEATNHLGRTERRRRQDHPVWRQSASLRHKSIICSSQATGYSQTTPE